MGNQISKEEKWDRKNYKLIKIENLSLHKRYFYIVLTTSIFQIMKENAINK